MDNRFDKMVMEFYEKEVEFQQTRRVYDSANISPTLATQEQMIFHNQVRRLTPLECERLQGFPDGWTEGVSDTQRYKQCGNAVTVNVVEAIIKQLIKEEVFK